jgi:hypothetical protein
VISFTSFDLASILIPYAAANSFVAQTQAFFLQQTGDPAASQQLAWRQLENLRQQQGLRLLISTPSGWWPC